MFFFSGMAMLQNGKFPPFFDGNILELLFGASNDPVITMLRRGLDKTGIVKVTISLIWIHYTEKCTILKNLLIFFFA